LRVVEAPFICHGGGGCCWARHARSSLNASPASAPFSPTICSSVSVGEIIVPMRSGCGCEAREVAPCASRHTTTHTNKMRDAAAARRGERGGGGGCLLLRAAFPAQDCSGAARAATRLGVRLKGLKGFRVVARVQRQGHALKGKCGWGGEGGGDLGMRAGHSVTAAFDALG
jgi:hypothetical protein